MKQEYLVSWITFLDIVAKQMISCTFSDPFVCHRGILGSGMLLIPGMIFTVEPMINEGSGGFYIDEEDGWTVYTEDGSLSAQIEYELLITEDGARVISK